MGNPPFPFRLLRAEVPRAPSFAVAATTVGSIESAKLDQNELPDPPPAELMEEVWRDLASSDWNRYPQPERYRETKTIFSEVVGVSCDRLILTAGCDQLIQLVMWAAGGRARRARIFEPTYPSYRALAAATGTELESVILGADFDLAEHHVTAPGSNLVALVSPNNPTGSVIDRDVVLAALEQPQVVLVDEAYIDYDDHGKSTVADLVPDHPNLVVGRSLSKAALAGARLGYGIAHPDLVEVLENLAFAPYHLNLFQLAIARSFRCLVPHIEKSVARVIRERERLRAEILAVGVRAGRRIEVWPSSGNFLLVSLAEASAVAASLLEGGIRVRDVSALPGLDSHLRITVGSEGESRALIKALRLRMRSRESER